MGRRVIIVCHQQGVNIATDIHCGNVTLLLQIKECDFTILCVHVGSIHVCVYMWVVYMCVCAYMYVCDTMPTSVGILCHTHTHTLTPVILQYKCTNPYTCYAMPYALWWLSGTSRHTQCIWPPNIRASIGCHEPYLGSDVMI